MIIVIPVAGKADSAAAEVAAVASVSFDAPNLRQSALRCCGSGVCLVPSLNWESYYDFVAVWSGEAEKMGATVDDIVAASY